MLSIVAGTLEPDDGKVIKGNNLRIAYLLQNPDFDKSKSVIENVVFANLTVILMPIIFGKNAVWFTFLVGELFTLIPTLYVAYINKDVYGYGKDGIATFADYTK